MYFVRGNKLLIWALSHNNITRYFFSLLAILFFVVVWYLSLYLPNDYQIQVSKAQIKQLKNQLHLLRRTTLENKELEETIPIARHQLSTLKKVYENRLNFPVYLCACAQKNGVTLSECNVESMCKDAWFSKQTISLSIDGSFDALKKFFLLLEQSKNLLQWDSLHISKAQPKKYFCRCLVHRYVI